MNDTFLLELKRNLDNCIAELNSIRHLFCLNPEADFSRDRKINFSTLINILLQLESNSLPNELMNYFDHTIVAPTSSAFIQQRKKLLAECMEFLFHDFNNTCSYIQTQTYKGYRLLACDGSDVNIARNPEDEDTYIRQGDKGYNQIHINALYDLLNHTYADITVQGGKKVHERQALNTMVDRYSGTMKAIFIADRGYESFNVFEHLIRKEQNFIIRIKDIHSNGIISNYALPDSEFDEQIETILTRRHTKETKENPNTYTILSPYTDFDFLDEDNKYYPTSFRIVRFEVSEGVYQSVATNLEEDEFPLEEIKKLYCARWGEETSFRQLKYTIGLVDFHSKNTDLILQEIYARLIIYNFCEMATCHAVVITKSETKYAYKINFATAVNICRAYLKDGGDENEKMLLIQKHLTPIRPDRTYPRHVRQKTVRHFMYRAA